MGPDSRTVIDSMCLEDMGIVVERVHDVLPEVRAETTDVPGRRGSVLSGTTLAQRPITLECRAFRDSWQDFELLKDELAAVLHQGGPFAVYLRNHPDEYYIARFVSMTEGDRIGGTGIGYLELNFMADDPWRYGPMKSLSVGTTDVTFYVEGSAPAAIEIATDAAVRNSTSEVWGLRFDDVDVVHVGIPVSTASSVSIDCDERTATVNGATAMVTLDSDWPILKPGIHTARVDQGTGSATVTWQERSA